MVDVYVARGLLKRKGAAPRPAPAERAPLTGAALVNAFREINPSRVTQVPAR